MRAAASRLLTARGGRLKAWKTGVLKNTVDRSYKLLLLKQINMATESMYAVTLGSQVII